MSHQTGDRRVLRRISTAMAEIVVAEMSPGCTAHRSTCPDGQFWLPVRGEQVIEGVPGSKRQRPFELLYYAPRQPAVRITDSPTLAYGFRVRLSGLREEERDHRWVQGRPLDWDTNRYVLNLILLGLSDASHLDEAVAQWLGPKRERRGENRRASWLGSVEELLQSDPSLTLLELSRQVGVVPAYLSAEFSRNRGVTVSGYRRQVMLQRALSTASDTNLNQSAIEAGFYDASHFHRACVAELGVKPSSLRQLIWPRS